MRGWEKKKWAGRGDRKKATILKGKKRNPPFCGIIPRFKPR
jgi:hypothetical protein